MRYYILITGASSGIGASIAGSLIKKGYHVIAGVRTPQDAERLSALYGSAIHPLMMDVTDPSTLEKARSAAEFLVEQGPLVAIINNAGIVVHGATLYIPVEEWQRQFDINVIGVIRVTQMFFPYLVREKAPGDRHPRRIINVSSISGLFASPFLGPYCSSKFALEALTDSFRRELYMYDVDVVLIEPGNINTPIWEKAKQGTTWLGPEYAPIMDFKDKIINSNISGGLPVSIIDAAIVNIIQRKTVRNRYLLRRRKWLFQLIRRLPSRWIDWLILKKLQQKSGIRPF